MIKVYGDLISGNCYKVKLILELTGTEHDWVPIDILKGESRTPEFLAMNPNGRIPLVDLGGGDYLAESNAALFYFAQATSFWPLDKRAQAEVLQWMFFEQYSHEPFIATSRYWIHIANEADEKAEWLAEAQPKGYAALDVMEKQLRANDFLAGSSATIADLALYAYTHRAHEGGFSLEGYPAIRSWIARIEVLPQFFPMP